MFGATHLVLTIGHAQHPKPCWGAGQAVESGQGDGAMGPIAPGHKVGIPLANERQREEAID